MPILERQFDDRLSRWPGIGLFGCFIWLAALLLQTVLSFGQQTVSREYQLKAVFLFHFAQFTQWPTNAFTSTNSPIVIGILGNDPFGDALKNTVRGELVNGRRIELEHFRRAEDATNCHILYLAATESRRPERILEVLENRPILTVSDVDTPAGRGVMIRFVQEQNKLRIRINLDAVSAANLTISSKLLRASEIVSSGRAR